MIELNISCHNVKSGGMAFGIKPETVEEVTRVAKKGAKNTPLIVKLSPNVESIANNAKAAERGGADCVSLINTLTGMAIDIERRRPIIANNTGGVSGAGVKPVAVRMVYEASQAVKIPVIGMGGITCAEDAIEFLMAGATAVQVGTANFTDPYAMPKIIKGLSDWCDRHNVANVSELTGTLQLNGR
jgi:dihydroorotate dehydrogenase (NAD+) catalytic subunit